MTVYIIKQCNQTAFKAAATKNVKVQEIELYEKTSNIYIVKEKSEAIKDCRKFNKKYKEFGIYYFTEIKLH